MDTAYKTTLELDKVLARAVQLCTCRETKALMQDLQPFDTVEEERYALAQTNAVNALLIKTAARASAASTRCAALWRTPKRAASCPWASCWKLPPRFAILRG